MTTATATATTALKSTSRRTAPTTTTHRQTLGRAIRSEWIKLRTLRSTWIGMGAVVLLLVGLGAIAAAVSTGSVTTPEDGGGFGNGDPLSTVLTGADFAVLLVGVLGALAGAREYGSRMISATIAAVPRRWQVVVSKAVVLTGVVLPTALIGVLAAFGVGMGILSAGDGATVALTDDGVLRSELGRGRHHRDGGGRQRARRHRRSAGPRRLGRPRPRRLRPGDHPSRRLTQITQTA